MATSQERLGMNLKKCIQRLRKVANRGPSHKARLENIDEKIVVTGTRGKSGATRWLYEILYGRGRDAFAKITGNRPLVLHDGESHPIERGRRVTLYENEAQLRQYAPVETAIFENQAIGEYTTRTVHQRFTDPDVIFLTNIRSDHLDWLGDTPTQIARSFARTIPDGVTLVVGEQRPTLRAVLKRELEETDVQIRWVLVPKALQNVPGAETILGLNDVLEALGEQPLSDRQIEAYIDEMQVRWTTLADGRVYNAASVNDIDSTEIVRRALDDNDVDTIQPLIYLRPDRRARTASFLSYLDGLYSDDVFEVTHAVGPHAELFDNQASFPVATHDASKSASAVLDAALSPGWPVFIMGNTVADFMRDLEAEIEARQADSSQGMPEESTSANEKRAIERPQ